MRFKVTLKSHIAAGGSFTLFSHTNDERKKVNKSLSVVWLPNLNLLVWDWSAALCSDCSKFVVFSE